MQSPAVAVLSPGVQVPPRLMFSGLGRSHRSIITTVFWVGEASDSDNGYIPNQESAWDGQWLQHYGGIDAPDKRNGFVPADFKPTENPFYAALPYNDLADEGGRKPAGAACLALTPTYSPDHSWCKNSWLAIRSGRRTAYAQWEDAGPFGEDDANYIFGSSRPANKTGEQAGLDISPAVQAYLGVTDVTLTDWQFVLPSQVPGGPWNTPPSRVTKSLGYTIY